MVRVVKTTDEVSAERVEGSSLVEFLTASVQDLVRVFGHPDRTDHGKWNTEWRIEFHDGTIATIYNYRIDEKMKFPDVWRIGGFTDKAGDHVREALKHGCNEG